MTERSAEATWQGDLKSGNGTMQTARGEFSTPFTFASRFGEETDISPEDLVAAAHAGCFAMALSHGLATGGNTPTRVQARATVNLGPDPAGGFHIGTIEIAVEAEVPGIGNDVFQETVRATLTGCPISKLYAGASISVNAMLVA